MSSRIIYVLLVEDDIDYSALLRRRLMGSLNKETDLTFIVAQTGLLNEAIDYTMHHAVDVIMLDLNLPDTTGLDTLARIQEVAPNAATIVLTGRDDQTVATQALAMGAQEYLCKGNFNTELLIRTIRYAMDRKQSERALSQVEETLRRVNGRWGQQQQDAPDPLPAEEFTPVVAVEDIANDFEALLTRMATQNSMALSELTTDNPARIHVEKLNQTINLAADLTQRLFHGLGSSYIRLPH